MRKNNENNERIKRTYFDYLKEAQRYSEASVDAAAAAIARFEDYTRHRDFKTFHHQQAIAFKRHLAEQTNHRGDGKLSKSTVRTTLSALRKFFEWLAREPGFRSQLKVSDADYFNPSDRDSRIALAQRPRPVPSLEQVIHVLSQMPSATNVQQRDRALIAFFALTGCRDGAAATLKLKHIDLSAGRVFQDAREVNTKNRKTITTYFFPVGDLPLEIFAQWISDLQAVHLWGPDDPLFPATEIGVGEQGLFQATGLKRGHWQDAGPIRRIFKTAFAQAGLSYFHPHSFRHMLTRRGQELCQTPEEFKAWSQNLGHENVLTTFTSYGKIEEHRQGEVMKSISEMNANDPGDDIDDLLGKLSRAMKLR